jgi:hypothetical protein
MISLISAAEVLKFGSESSISLVMASQIISYKKARLD